MSETDTLNINTPDLSALAASWPAPIVARREISKFTGGVVSAKYLANLDSAGKGPAGRLKIGRIVCYRVSDFVLWLQNRCKEKTL
jgi:hypothetical protein